VNQDRDHFARLTVDAVLRLKVRTELGRALVWGREPGLLLLAPLKKILVTLLCYQGSTNLENIQIIKKPGGRLEDSYLDPGAVCARGHCSAMRWATANRFDCTGRVFASQASSWTRSLA